MRQPRPFTLIASFLPVPAFHCPYCSNAAHWAVVRRELETEHWIRTFREARRLGALQLALTGGEPMLRRDLVELCAAARETGLILVAHHRGTLFSARARRRSSQPGSTTCNLAPEPERRGERPHRGE